MKRIQQAISRPAAGSDHFDMIMQSACETIIENLDCTRASIWGFSPAFDQITCAWLTDQRGQPNAKGLVLTKKDFTPYFDAITNDFVVMADDARANPATACFNENYFFPNDIYSLFDHIIYDGSKKLAILCCEQCETSRKWTDKDQQILRDVARLLTPVLKLRPHW